MPCEMPGESAAPTSRGSTLGAMAPQLCLCHPMRAYAPILPRTSQDVLRRLLARKGAREQAFAPAALCLDLP